MRLAQLSRRPLHFSTGPALPPLMLCTFTGTDTTQLTAYPWTPANSPPEIRPGANQWIDPSGYGYPSYLLNTNRCRYQYQGIFDVRVINLGAGTPRLSALTNLPVVPTLASLNVGLMIRTDATGVQGFSGRIVIGGSDYYLQIYDGVGVGVGTPAALGAWPAEHPWPSGERELVFTDNGSLMEFYFADTPGVKATHTSTTNNTNQYIGVLASASTANGFTWDNLTAAA